MKEFDELEFLEKDGKTSLKINNIKIKSLMGYKIKRDIDMVDVTITISVPVKNFKTTEN